MMDSDLIGQIIISSTFGVGRVVGVEKIGADDRYFLVVESVDQKLRNFIPMDDTKSFRTLLSKEELTKVVEDLSTDFEAVDYDSKKDRINYFKESSLFQDMENIVKLVKELNQLTDRGSVEDQIFKRLTSSLAAEYALINEVSEEAANEIIEIALNNA
ncbi:CarD family transcriptional regulator [Halobacteriovorax sp. HLS]|uniref:CarD family transcriptional regulator n=1 Tax=Halobacteriovorax sp. HLS TaxID=2234000 RepID=UPI000FD947EF|nr:CarD family transcriptional regulator [Halobacteriovorax sp. HLS]